MLEIRRRNFITLLGGAATWPLATRAQQGDRIRRIGALMPLDENDPVATTYVSAFTQALAGLGWADGRNLRMTFGGPAVTSIGYQRSRGNWLAYSQTSSSQPEPWRPLPSSGRCGRSRSSL
jgi:hypothetical protein